MSLVGTGSPGTAGSPESPDSIGTTESPGSALIGSIQKFSTEDGPGIRTTVFLKGCPLNCAWCHNPELISPGQQLIVSPSRCIACGACAAACPGSYIDLAMGYPGIDREACDLCMKCVNMCYSGALRPVARPMDAREVTDEVLKDKRFYDNTGGGLTISGGEVLSHAEFALELISECATHGVNSCIDTCGFGDYTDLIKLARADGVTTILYDIKSLDDDIHREYTGASNALILDNLERLSAEKPGHVEIHARLPLIAGINDEAGLANRTAIFLSALGIKTVTLIPYHNLGVAKSGRIGEAQPRFAPPERAKLDGLRKMYEDSDLLTNILGED